MAVPAMAASAFQAEWGPLQRTSILEIGPSIPKQHTAFQMEMCGMRRSSSSYANGGMYSGKIYIRF